MNLKQLEAFVCVADKKSFFQGRKEAVSDTADDQRAYCLIRERTGCKTVYQKYKGSQSFRGWYDPLQLRKADDRFGRTDRGVLLRGETV